MKYRLSTLLLLIVIAALALGWYVDHRDRSRREIIGIWCFPTPDQPMTGYYSTLVIRADGTFDKSQSDRFTTITFSGKHSIDGQGRIVFHLLSKLEENDFLQAVGRPHEKTETLDAKYYCRLAVDKQGYLIVADARPLWTLVEYGDTGIRWERSYAPK